MACKNTKSSKINLNHGCNPCNACDHCNRCACECQCDTPDYCADGCLTIQPSDCSTYSGVNIPCVGINKGDTMTSVIQKISAKLCDCCSGEPPVCVPLVVTSSLITPTSFRLSVTGLSLGDTWDISLNNGTSYLYSGLTNAFQDIPGLASNTAFTIKVRHNVPSIASCLTTLQIATTNEVNPCIPLVVTFSAIGSNSARLNIVNLPVGTFYNVSLDGGVTYDYMHIGTSFLDLVDLIPSNNYTVKVVIFDNSEAQECATIVNFSTTPCPTLTFPEEYFSFDGQFNPDLGIIQITPFWNAVPGALSYRLVDETNLIDMVLTPDILSQSYYVSWFNPTGATEICWTVYAELPWVGYCAVGKRCTAYASAGKCTTISNVSIASTTSNSFGPIFNVGWGCGGCTGGVRLYYREYTPGADWIESGSGLPNSGSTTIIPTSINPIKFNTMYQFRIASQCQGETYTYWYGDDFAISCIGSNLATTGTPSTAGVSFSFTEFATNADLYEVTLAGIGTQSFVPSVPGTVRTGTFPGAISSGSYALSLDLTINDHIRGDEYPIVHTCPNAINVII